jgi:hypothetical protein
MKPGERHDGPDPKPAEPDEDPKPAEPDDPKPAEPDEQQHGELESDCLRGCRANNTLPHDFIDGEGTGKKRPSPPLTLPPLHCIPPGKRTVC